jgi:uncharacterized membrane protein
LISNPSLLVVIVTGVWMAFAGHWWGRGWIWTSLGVLVILLSAMGFIARPYLHGARGRRTTGRRSDRSRQRNQTARRDMIGGLGLVALIFLIVFKPF